jgi:uncharacterized protein
MNAISLSLILLAAAPAPTGAKRGASFDCKKAATAVEKAICGDPDLAALDGELAAAYRRALAISTHPDSVRYGQQSWLERRRASCGADVTCLKSAYGAQIAELRKEKEVTASFDQAPFVSPHLVQDLTTWISDQGDQVLAISVSDTQDSDRYFVDELKVGKGPMPYVGFETKGEGDDPGESFRYRHVGRTTSGVDVLLTETWTGGTGVFTGLLLVTLRFEENGMSPRVFGEGNQTLTFKRRRQVIRRLGGIPLGDRWAGAVVVKENQIRIGKDTGTFSDRFPSKARVITIDYQP